MRSRQRLQWNPGGWFGSQVGGSAWILVGGLLCLPRDGTTGLIVLALFAAANLVGLQLWSRRARLSAYAGLQLLLVVLGLAGLATVFVLDRAGLFEAIQVGGRVSAGATCGLLAALIFGLMLFFRLRYGGGEPSR